MIQLSVDDRFGQLSLPPVEWITEPTIRAAVAAHQQARATAQQAQRDAVDAEQTLRAQAMAADAEAMADALEAGEPDPGQPRVREADEHIGNLHRRAEACKLIEARRHAELAQALSEHGDEWVASLRLQYDEAAVVWNQLLDALVQAHAKIGAIRSLLRFTETGRFSGVTATLDYIGTPPQLPADQAVAVLRNYAKPAESESSGESTAA